jgi:GR25 family glycosyltransferase involved in LPS biosynthesis
MSYRGFYINLDQNLERRSHIEKRLTAYQLKSRYTRFPACLGNALNLKAPKLSAGAIGCFSSHYLLLKSQIDSPTYIHVTEDDVVFSPVIATLLDTLLAKGVLGDYDMLYTDIFVPIDLQHVRDLAPCGSAKALS